MTRRTIAVLWFVVGLALWNRVFDLYVDRGVSQYLHLRAEFELGSAPEPSLSGVMDRAQRLGLRSATFWAAIVTASGWMTIWAMSRLRRE